MSDQAEIWYGGSWDQSDLYRAFKNELGFALGPPGAEISTIENSTYFFHFLTREKFAIFAVLTLHSAHMEYVCDGLRAMSILVAMVD